MLGGSAPQTPKVGLRPPGGMPSWYHVVFRGIPWYSMVPYGIPWYSMVFHGIPWYSMVFHGIPWYSMVFHGISWYSMVYHGIPWYSMVFHGTPWYTMVYHGIPWYPMVYHSVYLEAGGRLLGGLGGGAPQHSGGLGGRPPSKKLKTYSESATTNYSCKKWSWILLDGFRQDFAFSGQLWWQGFQLGRLRSNYALCTKVGKAFPVSEKKGKGDGGKHDYKRGVAIDETR